MCSIARSLEVVGQRWRLLIVRDAVFGGATRYSDFQRNLGIATNILKARLDRFVEAGIMRRHRYSDQPELYEYLLTEKGRALAPALVALSTCGAGVTQQTMCPHCGRVDDPAEIRAVIGPGMPADRRPQEA